MRDSTADTAELVVLLNADGEPVGHADKRAVHSANTPYHLAFSSYAFNSRGELLVTRRALDKPTWPGFWTNSCCGHPAPGETFQEAITRRYEAELGMTVRAVEVALPSFSYRAEFGGIVEHEFCPVYLCMTDEEPRPAETEVAAWQWWSWSRFVGAARRGHEDGRISPWAIAQVAQLCTDDLVERYLDACQLGKERRHNP